MSTGNWNSCYFLGRIVTDVEKEGNREKTERNRRKMKLRKRRMWNREMSKR
jgi:hypothetical protein